VYDIDLSLLTYEEEGIKIIFDIESFCDELLFTEKREFGYDFARCRSIESKYGSIFSCDRIYDVFSIGIFHRGMVAYFSI
jgi:hypothetical protein